MVEDPKWELAILATVQGFYEKLLQGPVGGEVPVPAGLEAVSLQGDNDVSETLSSMHRWPRMLDMAITPAMLRRAFDLGQLAAKRSGRFRCDPFRRPLHHLRLEHAAQFADSGGLVRGQLNNGAAAIVPAHNKSAVFEFL